MTSAATRLRVGLPLRPTVSCEPVASDIAEHTAVWRSVEVPWRHSAVTAVLGRLWLVPSTTTPGRRASMGPFTTTDEAWAALVEQRDMNEGEAVDLWEHQL